MPRNTIENSFPEFAHLIEPLFEAIKTEPREVGLKIFLKRAGIEPKDLFSSDLTNIATDIYYIYEQWLRPFIDENRELPDVSQLPDVIHQVKSLLERIEDLNADEIFWDAYDEAIGVGRRLLDYLVVVYLENHHKKLADALTLVDVINYPTGEGAPLVTFKPERLTSILNDSKSPFKIYGWNTKDFKSPLLFARLQWFLWSVGIPATLLTPDTTQIGRLSGDDEAEPEGWQLRVPLLNVTRNGNRVAMGLSLLPLSPRTGTDAGLAIVPYGTGSASETISLADDWVIRIDVLADATLDYGITIRPNAVDIGTLGDDNPPDRLQLRARLVRDSPGEERMVLLGNADGSRLEVGTIGLHMGVEFVRKTSGNKAEFLTALSVRDARLVLPVQPDDGFLSSLLPADGAPAEFSFNIEWSSIHGFYFEGSSSLEVTLPQNIELGPIKINQITLELLPEGTESGDSGTITFIASGSVTALLGPIAATIEEMGFQTSFSFPRERDGNLGLIDFYTGFKPPNGLGLTIDAGAAKGGGYLFFDHERQRYAGAMELTIAEFISAKAVGLITTRMPDGSSGFSMLVIVNAEFTPPFQLGFGFTLNGVGGLLGLNRTVLLDPLRDGVRTGAVKSMMFPDNVVENAPRIISDLQTIFPAYEDKFLIGPMGKMGWGNPTLITLTMGLIIEIPGNIAILGVLKVALPEERKPLVQIQVAFAGTLDFDKKKLTFDASLYESFILHMTLEGDMAVRLKWGDQPDFILTVGGFHPSFNPPPMALPTLRRLSISILNTSIAKIRVECYQAITSNTVQFGAKAEIYFDLKACSIDGHITFDALFQFSPFYFIIQLSSSFNLKAGRISVKSVRVKMSLEGTTPWKAKGTGSVSLLLVTISADFNKVWGDKKDTSLPKIEILPKLIDELHEAAQWSTDLSSEKNLLVTLRKLEKAAIPELILHPSGSLMVQQKLMPLSVNIDKVGNRKTSDIKKAFISGAFTEDINGNQSALEISEVKESFARAQYQELKDSEKLSKPSFEKMPGGVRISMGNQTIRNGVMVRKKVEYDVTIVDKEPVKPFKYGKFFTEVEALFTNFLKGSSVSKSVLSLSHHKKLQPYEEKVDVLDEGYTVAFQSNNKAFDASATFSSEMMAESYMQDQISKDPALKKQVHIIPNYELQV